MVLYAVLASMGHDGAIATARDAGAVPRRPPDPGRRQGRPARHFLRPAARRLLRHPPGRPGDPPVHRSGQRHARSDHGRRQGRATLLDELVRSATPLLSVLNGLTLVYEEQAWPPRPASAARCCAT
ncbi:hypothetical protein LP420_33235 [Massilia sp. B-10]|nr:hypothetical protein LP420_33235 [Massilia sp. B-10]